MQLPLPLPTPMATSSLPQRGFTAPPASNTNASGKPPLNSPHPYLIIKLRLANPTKIRIRIPKVLVKTMLRGRGRSQRPRMELVVSRRHSDGNGVTPKGISMMVGFSRKEKLPLQDERSVSNDVVMPSDTVRSSKPHWALSVPRDKFAGRSIGHKFARKARLFRRVTWGKLPKKPVFRHPNLFRKNSGVELLKSKVEKNDANIVIQNRDVPRIRRTSQGKQGQGVSAGKSICQPETRMDDRGEDRKDGELELCKKRILIGHKCRPLGRSGTLRYDQDGILLPELFP